MKVTLCVQNLVSSLVLCSNLSSLGGGEKGGGKGGRQGMGRGFDIFQKFPVKFPAHYQSFMSQMKKNVPTPGYTFNCCQISQD